MVLAIKTFTQWTLQKYLNKLIKSYDPWFFITCNMIYNSAFKLIKNFFQKEFYTYAQNVKQIVQVDLYCIPTIWHC